jgi:hypothetical protein
MPLHELSYENIEPANPQGISAPDLPSRGRTTPLAR